MSHPLLTKVLDDALHKPSDREGASVVADIPPDIADRLERALDACAGCGHPRDGHDFTPPNDCHATPDRKSVV